MSQTGSWPLSPCKLKQDQPSQCDGLYKWCKTALCSGRSTIDGFKRRRRGGRLPGLLSSETGEIVHVRLCMRWSHSSRAPSPRPPSCSSSTSSFPRPLRVPTPPPHPPSGPPTYSDGRISTRTPCLIRWDGHTRFHWLLDQCAWQWGPSFCWSFTEHEFV